MQELIIQIASAVNTRTLYPANHPRVVRAVEEMVSAVGRAAAGEKSDSVTFLIVGDDLVAGLYAGLVTWLLLRLL